MASRPLPARATADLSRAFPDDLHSSSSPISSSGSRAFHESNNHGTSREPASQTGERSGSSSTTLQEAMARSRSLLENMEPSFSSDVSSSSRRPLGETPNEYLERRTRSIAEAHRNILGRSRRRTDHARAFFERERNADHRRPFSDALSPMAEHDQSSRTAMPGGQSETVTPHSLRLALPRYTSTADHARQEQSRSAFAHGNETSQVARYISPFSGIGASTSQLGDEASADWLSGSRSTAAAPPSAMKRSFEEGSGRPSIPTPRLTTETASSESEGTAAAASGSRPLRIGRPHSRQGPMRIPWTSPCGGATSKRQRPEPTTESRTAGARSTPQVASTSREPMTATSFRSSSPPMSNLATRMTSFPPALGLSSEDRVSSAMVTPSPAASEDDPPFLVEDDVDSEIDDDHLDAPTVSLGTSAQHTANTRESPRRSMLVEQSPLTDSWTTRLDGPSSNAHASSIGNPRGTFIYQRFSQQLQTLQTQIDAARAEVLRHQVTYQDLRESSSASSGSTQAQWHLNQTRVLLERSRDQLDRFRDLLSGRQPSTIEEAGTPSAEDHSDVGSDGDHTTTPIRYGPPSLPLIRSNSPLGTPFTEHGAFAEHLRPTGEVMPSLLHPSSALLSDADRHPWGASTSIAPRSRPSLESARWNIARSRREQGDATLPPALRDGRSSHRTSDETDLPRQTDEGLLAPRPDLSHIGFSQSGTLPEHRSWSDGGTAGSRDSSSSRLPSQSRPAPSPRRQWPYTPIGTIPMLSAGSPGLRNEPLDFARLHSQEAAEIEEMQARTSLEEERQERQQRDRSRPTSSAESHSFPSRMMAQIWSELDSHSVGDVLARSEASGDEGQTGQLRDIMRGTSARETAAAALRASDRADSGRQTYQQMMDSLWPPPTGRRVQDHSPRIPAQRSPAAALSGDGRYGIDGSVGVDASDSGRTSADALYRRSRFLFGDTTSVASGTSPASDDRLRSGELNYGNLTHLQSSRLGARLGTTIVSTTATTTTATATARAGTDRPETEREDVDTLLRRLNMPAGLEESLLGFLDDSRSEVRRGASESTLEGLSVFSYESRYAHLLAERGKREGSAGHKGKARATDEDLTAQSLQGTDGAISSSSCSSGAASSSSSPSPSAASASGSSAETAPLDQCPICLEEYEGHHKMAACWCEHEFHETCLKTWLRQTKSCPLCRSTEPGTGGDGLRSASGNFARYFLPDFEV